MNQLVWVGLQSLAFSVVLTPIFRDIFRSFNVVDRPDQAGRKVHIHPIPRVGGIGIALAYVLTYFLTRPSSGLPLGRELSLIENLLPAALVVFVTGLIDDFFGLKPWQKLLGQLGGAGLACWGGVLIQSTGGHTMPVIFSVPLTIGWLLVCTNAFNLVDGLDGLAAGVGLFATLTIFTAALLQGNQPLAFATLPLAGCLLGFLCFNFNPATVFLGDGGSLLIGFLLGCFGVIWTQKSVTLLGITAPLMAMSVPLLDVLLCIVRRWLRDQPIFSADRGHIHHRLLDRGLTTKQTVFLLYGLCGFGAVFSLAQSFVNDIYIAALVVIVFIAVAWMCVRYLGYAEFMLAGRLIRTGEFQRNVSAQLNLTSFEKSLAAAQTLDDCWTAIVRAHQTFGFAGVRMSIGGIAYEDWELRHSEQNYWVIRIPLPARDYLELAREFNSPVLPMALAPFVDMLGSALSSKLKQGRETADSARSASSILQPEHL